MAFLPLAVRCLCVEDKTMNAYAMEQLAEQHYRDLVALAQAAGTSRRQRRGRRRVDHNPVQVLTAAVRLVRLPARLGSQTRNCAHC
jgi:hypothetical protein